VYLFVKRAVIYSGRMLISIRIVECVWSQDCLRLALRIGPVRCCSQIYHFRHNFDSLITLVRHGKFFFSHSFPHTLSSPLFVLFTFIQTRFFFYLFIMFFKIHNKNQLNIYCSIKVRYSSDDVLIPGNILSLF
jgi:hypothetical protein